MEAGLTQLSERQARDLLSEYGQDHVLTFWDCLDGAGRQALSGDLGTIDFALVNRLIDEWILHEPRVESFSNIEPIPVIPPAEFSRPDAREAFAAGEEALRTGRVGLLMVAGGQGTRLSFDGPKGAYPIGPISQKSLFAFHAEKIHNIQRRYGCTLPWYIMVSSATEGATERFFRDNQFFGLAESNIRFFRQGMMPCVDSQGRFMLESPHRLAMNPNGHGGCIPAMVEHEVTGDARQRGVDLLSYFQVDNWAVKVADPPFIGYHVLGNAQMSSKVHRKNTAREPVGVHCICDGEYRVIEYTELDIYRQLLDTDAEGRLIHFAGNPAMHVIAIDFVEHVYHLYDRFPWHCSHKKIAYIDDHGSPVQPKKPNGYKFETFVFDALRFVDHEPVALEIRRAGEYTPIKSFDGDTSVVAARKSMRNYWGEWLETAGCRLPRDESGEIAVSIEISPRFALTREEFLEKFTGRSCPVDGDIGISPDGDWLKVPETV